MLPTSNGLGGAAGSEALGAKDASDPAADAPRGSGGTAGAARGERGARSCDEALRASSTDPAASALSRSGVWGLIRRSMLKSGELTAPGS
jgi:hypothetical protein